jgi:hypothetical protein
MLVHTGSALPAIQSRLLPHVAKQQGRRPSSPSYQCLLRATVQPAEPQAVRLTAQPVCQLR